MGRKDRSTMDPEERRQAFLTAASAETRRVLVTLLFTDLVRSTEQLVTLGDRRWRRVLEAHHAASRELFSRFGGREVDCAGDGFFAWFDTATGAVCCGAAVVESARALGLLVRAGLHTGECEPLAERLCGVAVHTAARLAQVAEPGEVLVTTTVRDVVAGSGLRFADRGEHSLKGLPGTRRLYAFDGPVTVSDDAHPPVVVRATASPARKRGPRTAAYSGRRATGR
jgi:class 3 adenylate cyclase